MPRDQDYEYNNLSAALLHCGRCISGSPCMQHSDSRTLPGGGGNYWTRVLPHAGTRVPHSRAECDCSERDGRLVGGQCRAWESRVPGQV